MLSSNRTLVVESKSLLNTLKSLDASMKSSLRNLEMFMASNKLAVAATAAPAVPDLPVALDRKIGESAPVDKKRTDQVTVSVTIMFMKIGTIDTIHDRFQADVNITLKWREPQLDGKKLKSDDVDFSEYWNPKVMITNNLGDMKAKVSQSLKYDINGRAMMRETRSVSGYFFEFMELNQFPFDGQDLTVTISSEHDTSAIQLVEDDQEHCGIHLKAFSAAQEWKIFPEVNVWKKIITKKANKVVRKHPQFNTSAKATRRPQFFIWNIIVIMSVICSMAFATFTVCLSQPQFRLQLTFILLLTTVTFKFAVNKNLPKISYLTYMDKYILCAMVILFCVCIWHAVVGGIIHPYNKPTSSTTTVTTVFASTVTPAAVQSARGNLTEAPVSYTTDSSVNSTKSTCTTSSSSCPLVSSGTQLADYVALGTLLSLYVLLHVVLIAAILCTNDEDMSLNVEVDDSSRPSTAAPPSTKTEINTSDKTIVSLNNPPVYNNLAFRDDNNRVNGNAAKTQNRPVIG